MDSNLFEQTHYIAIESHLLELRSIASLGWYLVGTIAWMHMLVFDGLGPIVMCICVLDALFGLRRLFVPARSIEKHP